MRTLLHLVKYNLIFQKTRIGFLSVVALIMTGLVYYFMETYEDFGEGLMQYSSYILFVLFTGKMNARNSQMFDIKHLLAMPMTKKEIILTKSVADIIQIFPVILTFLWGFHIQFPQYHLPFVFIIFFLVVTVANIIAFSKRIDFFRMQHSKSHIRNSFLYFHKYLELMIVILMVSIGVSLILSVFQKNILMMEYSFIVLLVLAAFLSSNNALKMLKDETLSYFIYRRDIFRIGWKLLLFIVPALGFHFVYKGKNKDMAAVPNYLKAPLEHIENIESQRFMLSMVTKDKEFFHQYLDEKRPIPWDSEVKGMYPPHVAVLSGDYEILSRILEVKPEVVDMPGKHRNSTPLFVAMLHCKVDLAQLLIERGANINHINKDGDTPLHYAASNNCPGGVLTLLKNGADATIENKKDQKLADILMRKKDGMYQHLLLQGVIQAPSRGIASASAEEHSAEYSQPAQPLPQE